MKSFFIRAITFYQKWISPMFPARCKYYPSCSAYAATAIAKHGFIGIVMASWRILRCNPWSHGGVDYVPEKTPYFHRTNSPQSSKGVSP